MRVEADVAVIGAGFGGSLMALVLDRIGLRPVLLDRRSHPRFAIGESSTPVANLVLADLARTYGLPRLQPLAKYGTWQATYPEVTCGIKRGFSYFRQRPHEPFGARADHANELLVAASRDDPRADTHWLRSDVDAFLVREVESAGIAYLDQAAWAVQQQRPQWIVAGQRQGRSVAITAPFLIDASGEAGFLQRALRIADRPAAVQTQSWALFGHFVGVQPWQQLYAQAGGTIADHPFACDHAAVHQVLDEGWMWQLRFNNGVTSAGFALDPARFPPDPQMPPEQQWNWLLQKYPSLGRQFAAARRVQPAEGLRRTGRLQRLAERVAGHDWAMLPHTAGFIDPLHSSGIAQTMCGIERLAGILAEHWGRRRLPDELRHYQQAVLAEIALVDQLVEGCYQASSDFSLYASFAMLYFAAATTYEHRRLQGQLAPGAAFLCADDAGLRAAVRSARKHLQDGLRATDRSAAAVRFQETIAELIRPFNVAGLCDPNVANMYRHTAMAVE